MGWHRYRGRALAGAALTGEARDTELEAFIRLDRSDLCDVRLESATETADFEASRRWYDVTYLADDGCGA
ncbi:hypothetical protein A5658_18350 [Mycobacterium sp. 1245111.1]|uniref:hypothetical protein n=1 Tax=Mycobacterium sp. 1245111.1 TaxID=1834073 RepID=UPI0007FC95F6|nr:hypothetical protein [Mycobacterium sp. 1245111.1]OBK41519.1 hypothetical protein A5658_18350 [Mycobacterium sp. 1245111.1]